MYSYPYEVAVYAEGANQAVAVCIVAVEGSSVQNRMNKWMTKVLLFSLTIGYWTRHIFSQILGWTQQKWYGISIKIYVF